MYSFSIFDCKEHNQSGFSTDHLVMIIQSHLSCFQKRGLALTGVSLDKVVCPVSFCTPRPTMPVTPGISWLLLLHPNPLWWKGHCYLVLAWECVVGLHETGQFQLLWHQWLRHAAAVKSRQSPHRRQPTRLPSLGFSRQEYWSGLPFTSPVVEAYTWIIVMLCGLPWKWTKIILSFVRLHPNTAFETLWVTVMATSFLLRKSCSQ